MRFLSALFIFIASLVSIAIMGIAAHFLSWMFIFPSLGPSIFLIFYAPSSPMSAPKNTVLGHLIGIMTGFLLFKLALLTHPQGIPQIMEFIVAGLALGISGMVMVLTDILHPPAASSCLIAALGLVKNEYHIMAMMITVCLICIQGYVMNKMAGVKYPLWAPFEKMTLPYIKTPLGDIRELEQKDKLKELAAKLAMRQKIKN